MIVVVTESMAHLKEVDNNRTNEIWYRSVGEAKRRVPMATFEGSKNRQGKRRIGVIMTSRSCVYCWAKEVNVAAKMLSREEKRRRGGTKPSGD